MGLLEVGRDEKLVEENFWFWCVLQSSGLWRVLLVSGFFCGVRMFRKRSMAA